MNNKKEFLKDKLKVKIYADREQMGQAAAESARTAIKKILAEKEELNIIFASAPSQTEFLNTLIDSNGIDWNRVNGFHMDEYIGISPDAPQSFCKYLEDTIFTRVKFNNMFYINGETTDADQECQRYAALLKKYPVDIVCLGIGENGHLAFNDPGIADFKDPELVKIVEELDEKARMQQVHEGHFASFEEVPSRAITLTIPALFAAKHAYIMVPGDYKRKIVKKTIEDEISPDCPGTIMRHHPEATLYLDADSASLIDA
jgi:glucosamine-6-phosphate deaminase